MEKYQIFISYRREGGDMLAGRLCDRFKSLGYSVFFDTESMHSGRFNDQIYTAIENSDNLLLVLPRGALDEREGDDWVRNELTHAFKYNKHIIPVMANGFEFPETLPEELDDIRYIEGVTILNEYFDAAVERIKSFLVNSDGDNNEVQPAQKTENELTLKKAEYEKAKKEYGEDSLEANNANMKVARAYQRLGDNENALSIFEEVYSAYLQKNASSIYLRDVVYELSELYEKTGDIDKAIATYEVLYKKLCEAKNESSFYAVNTYKNLSRLYIKKGENQKALNLSGKAYELRLNWNKTERNDITLIFADANALSGNHQKALELYKKVYANEKFRLAKSPILEKIADSYSALGDYKRAADAYEKVIALEDITRNLRLSNPESTSVLKKYLEACKRLNTPERAYSLIEKEYDKHRKSIIYGENSTVTFDYLDKTAAIYGKIGECSRQIELYTRRYNICLKKRKITDKEALYSLRLLASAHKAAGNREGALSLYKKGYDNCNLSLGASHRNTLQMLCFMAVSHYELGDYDKAEMHLENAYDGYCETLGETNATTLKCLESLISTYLKRQKYKKAAEYAERLYAAHVKEYGELDVKTLVALKKYAACVFKTKDIELTLVMYERLHAQQTEVFGAENEETKESLKIIEKIKSSIK